jgi:hypothetical protein
MEKINTVCLKIIDSFLEKNLSEINIKLLIGEA